MNFTECAAFGYHVIHCDDDQCMSGSCTTEDNFLENLEESSNDDQCYDRSRYKSGWLEKNIPQAGFRIAALNSISHWLLRKSIQYLCSAFFGLNFRRKVALDYQTMIGRSFS